MADEAAPRDRVGAGEEARPLLIEAARNPAERMGARVATDAAMSEKNVRLRDRKMTLVDQIALLEAVRGPRRRWARGDDGDGDDDQRVPRDPMQTEGASRRKTRAYFVWIALASLLLVAVLTVQSRPQLCFQGYCLTYQPPPIAAFRGGPRRDMAVMTVTVRDGGESTGAAEWVWSLGADGKLSRRPMGAGAEWDTYEATRFLGAPVVQGRGSAVRLFAVEAGTGHLMVSAYFGGDADGRRPAGEEARHRAAAWDRGWAARPGAWGWHSLGGRFVHQPALAEAATGHVEAYAVTDGGALLRRVLAPGPAGGWGAWAALGDRGFVGEVDVLVSYMDSGRAAQQGEVRAAALKDGQYHTAVSFVSPRPWTGVWWPLGVPDRCRGGAELGWPVLVGLGRGEFDLVVACGGGVWHKLYGWAGEWPGRWEALGTLRKGVRLDPHSLTRAARDDGEPPGLYARASVSGCVYRSTHLDGQHAQHRWPGDPESPWSHWRRVWCPEERRAAGNLSLAVDPVGARAVALGEPGGTFLYSGLIDFHSSDPLQWQRHDRPQLAAPM